MAKRLKLERKPALRERMKLNRLNLAKGASTMESEKQAVIEQLKEYDRKFSAIIDLIGGRDRLFNEEKSQAQEMLRGLKDDLERDCRDLHGRESDLNQFERGYLEPALRKAAANISVRVNTVPGSEWSANLYSAQIDITWMLSQLTDAD